MQLFVNIHVDQFPITKWFFGIDEKDSYFKTARLALAIISGLFIPIFICLALDVSVHLLNSLSNNKLIIISEQVEGQTNYSETRERFCPIFSFLS